ncbi:MAG: di-trans,poly-cis-decaprenylcistransferase [Legionellales bacterium]|jgi:undecaprenyl diphosphate synthase|nr:di-trans,poly-cis-decaprenylcistransferase [Legionellales bacterium]
MTIPKHIAVIMDGNGRWAKGLNLPRVYGHRVGVDVAKKIIDQTINLGIKQLTLFAFSTENMNRPKVEVLFLLKLFEKILEQELDCFLEKNIKLKFIGNLEKLPIKLKDLVLSASEKSCKNNGMVVLIAINYSGRWQLSEVVKEIARDVSHGDTAIDSIDEKLVSAKINNTCISDPDLLIRTGGEFRVSNFMLWSLAYSEVYFVDKLWPDFTDKDLIAALNFYATRNRRYGLLEETEYE